MSDDGRTKNADVPRVASTTKLGVKRIDDIFWIRLMDGTSSLQLSVAAPISEVVLMQTPL